MNMFTLAQLVNHTTGTTYYDTKSGGIKYSPSPNLTMFGYDSYDTTLIKGKKTENINKDKPFKKTLNQVVIKKPTRKVNIVPDDKRCCSNKSDGSQCTLKKYKTEEMCYIHYKKTLPKPIKNAVPEVVVKKISKKWFCLHF